MRTAAIHVHVEKNWAAVLQAPNNGTHLVAALECLLQKPDHLSHAPLWL